MFNLIRGYFIKESLYFIDLTNFENLFLKNYYKLSRQQIQSSSAVIHLFSLIGLL